MIPPSDTVYQGSLSAQRFFFFLPRFSALLAGDSSTFPSPPPRHYTGSLTPNSSPFALATDLDAPLSCSTPRALLRRLSVSLHAYRRRKPGSTPPGSWESMGNRRIPERVAVASQARNACVRGAGHARQGPWWPFKHGVTPPFTLLAPLSSSPSSPHSLSSSFDHSTAAGTWMKHTSHCIISGSFTLQLLCPCPFPIIWGR